MLLSIGQMSKLNNISIHTLRYYDKIDLLTPSFVDAKTNYRYYNQEDCEKLFRIKIFRSIGISLEEIKSLLSGDICKVKSSYKNMKEDLQKQIQELNKISNYLDDELKHIENYFKNDFHTEPIIKKLLKRQGYIIPVDDSSSFLDRVRAINNFEKSTNSNADVFFRPSRLISFDLDGQRVLQCYLAISRDCILLKDKQYKELDTGNYIIIDNIGNHDIKDSYKKLIQYMKDNNLTYNNHAIELIIHNDIFNDINIKHTQIQVPIQLQ